MTDYIKLGFSLLLLVFIFFGFLWGIFRGLKKTVSRGLFLLLISILLIFIAVPITNLILKININCNISTETFELIGRYNVSEILTKLIETYIGTDFVTKYPDFAQVIVSFVIILVNSIVYLVLFWLLKYLLMPLNTLLTKLIFPKRRKKAEAIGFAANADSGDAQPLDDSNAQIVANNEAKDTSQKITNKGSKKDKKPKVKEKKRRMLGGLVGIAVGLVVTFNTMLPIYGIFDILESAKELKLENITEEPTDLSSLTNGMIDEITDGYKTSVMKAVSKYTGLEAAGLVGFDTVTTAKIDGEKITLRDEVDAVIKTVEQADTLLGKYNTYSKDNFKSITQEQLDELLAETRTLISKCENIKIVDCLADYMLPIACSYMIKSNMKVTSSPVVDEMIKDTLVTLINASGIDVIGEIYRLLDIADYTSEQGLLIKVIKNDTSEPLKLLEGLEEDFGKNLITKVFNLQTVDITLTHIFNIGLTYFEEVSNFGYSESSLTKDTLKDKLTTLVDDTFKLALTMDSSSPVMVTFDSVKPLGKLLNTVKSSGLINSETYTNLVIYATQKLKEISSSIVPEDFVDVFNNQIINNINSVENWETEMNSISLAIDQLRAVDGGIIGEVIDGNELRVGNSVSLNMDEATINNLGIALDYLENTVIFGTELEQQVYENGEYYKGTTITKLLASICDYATDMVADGEASTLSGFTEVIKSIRSNIISASHIYNPSSPNFYANEFKQISPLLVELNNILTGGAVELNTELGVKLDKAKSSVMFGNKTTLLLIKESINIVSDEILGSDFSYNSDTSVQTTNDKIYELFEDIKEQLDTIAVLNQSKQDSNFWQHEMESYLALKNIAENSSSITTTEEFLPYGADLDTTYSCYTIPKSGLNSVISFTIKQLKTSATTGIEGKINELIDDIATNIESETFENPLKDYTNYWQIELNHIHSLNSLEFEEKEDDISTPDVDESFTYGDIGFTLDKVTLGYTESGSDTTLGYVSGNADSTRASYLISHNMVRELLGAGIDEMSGAILSAFTDDTVKNAVTTALGSIKTNITNTTSIPTISFHTEMTNLGKLADLDISTDIFDNPTSLQTLGETLDEIAYNKTETTSGSNTTVAYDSTLNSKVITRPIIGTMIKDILPIAKSGEDTPTATDTVVDGISTNVTTLMSKDAVLSWAKEFTLVSSVMELKNATINDDTYEALGSTIDSIAFNKIGSTYNYNDITFEDNGTIITTDTTLLDTANSLLITRQMLNTNIASIIDDMATSETNETIKATLTDIADSIDVNTYKIYSWTKEIQKVNELKKLNETEVYSSDIDLPEGTTVDENGEITFPEGSNYTLADNSLIKLAKNIDAISFNNDGTNYSDTQFDGNNIVTSEGTNSIIITREILRDMMASFLNDAKPTGEPTDEDRITIDIINNTTDKINISNVIDTTNYFTTSEDSFTALLTANTQISNTSDEFSDISLSDVTPAQAAKLDTLLENLQGNLISGVATTKKVAKLILSKLNAKMISLYSAAGQSFTNTDIGQYISYLSSYYDNTEIGEVVYKTDATDYPLKDADENYVTSNPFSTIIANYVSAI